MNEDINKMKISREYYKEYSKYLFLLCICVNIIGAEVVQIIRIPAFLDAAGTILAGLLMGSIPGAIVGLITNIALGFLMDSSYFYFAVINVLIGLIAGYIFSKYPFNIKTVLIASIIISVMASVIGNAISIVVFGGILDGSLSDLSMLLVENGLNLFLSVTITGFFANLLDKLLSFVLVFYIVGIIENRIEKDRSRRKLR
uniref:Signal transduction histidine kinase, LytS n=1 Tax=Methanococcus maripaludis (strain C6 / ATCC BAA-1332) TaxID=444158 RepID=A9A7J3_METM6